MIDRRYGRFFVLTAVTVRKKRRSVNATVWLLTACLLTAMLLTN
jgi:hypothetical protein